MRREEGGERMVYRTGQRTRNTTTTCHNMTARGGSSLLCIHTHPLHVRPKSGYTRVVLHAEVLTPQQALYLFEGRFETVRHTSHSLETTHRNQEGEAWCIYIYVSLLCSLKEVSYTHTVWKNTDTNLTHSFIHLDST